VHEADPRAPVLIVGVGNSTRADDGAGPDVARAVGRARLAGVETVELDGDLSLLLEACEGRDTVVVVDAAASGAPAGTIHRLDAAGAAALGRPAASSHGLGVAAVVALARATARLPRRLEVVAIEGGTFVPGAPRSPEVGRACREVARELVRRFRRRG
jgi:hydrogenase maturation protease